MGAAGWSQTKGTAVIDASELYHLDDMLTDDERAVRDRVRDFCRTEVLPIANDHWERGAYPRDLLPKFADLGIAGGTTEGYGCAGLSPVANGLVSLELARADGSVCTLFGVHSGLAMGTIAMLGSDEQKQRWLPAMAGMERIGAFALTEPDHGSDVVALETRARRDGDEWVLDGQKRWIGNGSEADVIVVWARDDDDNVGGFVVDHPEGGRLDGFSSSVITGKTGNRAVWQANLQFDGVRIPADHRLVHAETFADTSTFLAHSRQGVAWEALGHAEAAYAYSLEYALDRKQFGRPIAGFQLIQDKLARMLAEITSMRLLCMRLAELQAQAKDSLAVSSLAKLHTASGARRVCQDARDLMGGNGLLLEYQVARHLADVEATYTYEGTDTVQALIVGREITGLQAFAN
ncbi:MAG: acyl-CoA dehydrogenase family protein [Actinobacteria bacterium]|nr:acyl-CoA dehydrogenase family protein [Actinomycetota bacterium]